MHKKDANINRYSPESPVYVRVGGRRYYNTADAFSYRQEMPFQAVAFISSEENLCEREKSIVDRLIRSDVLFLVMGSRA
jgi:hypothetical protein